MKFETIIGLEVHIQLNTASKLFCTCQNVVADASPNQHVCPVCFGMVGSLPLLNRQAVLLALRAGTAAACTIPERSKWDRKHYFYPDLPKGYQISQYDMPLATKGLIEFFDEKNNLKQVRINRIHLEEDAAKLIHTREKTLVDFNRAGSPLIEVVTEPDLRSPADARSFAKELQRVVRIFGISNADMEKGQLRCDASISLRPVGETILYPRTEIKNLNSFRMVEKALQYEIEKQTTAWESQQIPDYAQTVLWDDARGETVFMRGKEQEADYRYFPEPDIPEIQVTTALLREATHDLPSLPIKTMKNYLSQGLEMSTAHLLASNSTLADFFDAAFSNVEQPTKLSRELEKWFIAFIFPECKKRSLFILSLQPTDFTMLVQAVIQGEISRLYAKELLLEALHRPVNMREKIQYTASTAVIDIQVAVANVLDECSDVAKEYKAGKEKALHVLIGKVVKNTGGVVTIDKIIQEIKKQLNGL